MRTGQPPALVGALGLLERAVAYTRMSLGGIRPDLLDLPTPCADWDLRALLRHMDDSLAALHEAGAAGRVSLAAPPGSGHDVLGSIRDRACTLLGAWTHNAGADLVTVAGSPVSAAVLAAAGALEITVHGWDVAATCGRRHRIPPALAEELLELVDLLVAPADRPQRFGPVLPVAADAPSDARLLAAVGRSHSAPVPSPDRRRTTTSGVE